MSSGKPMPSPGGLPTQMQKQPTLLVAAIELAYCVSQHALTPMQTLDLAC